MITLAFPRGSDNVDEELNAWLWPALLGDLMADSQTTLLGVGTSLNGQAGHKHLGRWLKASIQVSGFGKAKWAHVTPPVGHPAAISITWLPLCVAWLSVMDSSAAKGCFLAGLSSWSSE